METLVLLEEFAYLDVLGLLDVFFTRVLMEFGGVGVGDVFLDEVFKTDIFSVVLFFIEELVNDFT